MGTPTYTSGSDSSVTGGNKTRNKSAMVEMLELLEEVERCREVVADRQRDLDSAKNDLERAEQKVSAQINKLDPETKARFRRMIGGIVSQGQNER